MYAISTFRLFINENSCSRNASALYDVFVITTLKSRNLIRPDNTVTPLIWPIFFYPLVTVLTGFHCMKLDMPEKRLELSPANDTTGNPGSVIVPQYGSSKITVFVWSKNTSLKFVGNTKSYSAVSCCCP